MPATAWRAWSAVEAVRRLRPRGLGGLDAAGERIRLRPATHLGFAAGEVEDLRERDGRLELVLALPALYGPGSPLPAYATERLLGQEREASRALIDLLNHRLLSLTLLVAGRRELEAADARAARLAARTGLGDRVDRMRWAGLLRSRAAADLEAILADLCAPLPARLEQQIAVDAPLPVESRARLGGARLGIDATIGATVATRATAFRVSLGPMPAEAARAVAEGDLPSAIAELVDDFNSELLDWELALIIDGKSLAPGILGGSSALARSARLDGTPLLSYRRVCSTSESFAH